MSKGAGGSGVKKQRVVKKGLIVQSAQKTSTSLKTPDQPVIPSSMVVMQKPTKKISVKKKGTKKSTEETTKIVTSKSISSLGIEPKPAIKKKANASQPTSKTSVTKLKNAEKNECPTSTKIGEKKASGEHPEGKRNSKKLVKKLSKESGSSTQSKTLKIPSAKRKDVLSSQIPATTSKAPTASKKITKKLSLQKKESPARTHKRHSSPDHSSCFKSDISSITSDTKLTVSASSQSVRSAISIINLDLPKSSSVIFPKIDENDHWGTTWKEGVNYDPINDDDFLAKVKAADKRVWKACKFKKRVSISPELSEIEEETADEAYLFDAVEKRKERLKKRFSGRTKIGSRLNSRDVLRF